MNISELRILLQKSAIRDNAYSLDGGLPHDRHVLNNLGDGRWEVYYSERGGKFETEQFRSESEACQCILQRLLGDSTARD